MKLNKKILFAVLTAAVLTAAVCYLLWRESNSLIVSQKLTADISFNIQEKKYIQLLFVGDLMFDRGIRYYAAKNGGNEFIFEKISAMLLSSDLVIANLEGPITDNKSLSAGTAPGSADNYVFTFDPGLAETLYKENIRLVNLGNNHILNFGVKGLEATEKYLNQSSIDYFGAPYGSKSITKNINGIGIGFVNYNEFAVNIDTEQKTTIDEIKKAKSDSDIAIVFCHWGVEYEKNPSKEQINLAQKFIDSGADLIIGSHPHVIQSMEEYNSKRIYYSLGNFVFDQHFSEDVRNGLGVIVKINKETKELEFEEIQFYLDSNGQTILRPDLPENLR